MKPSNAFAWAGAGPRRASGGRKLARVGLVLVVLALHSCVTQWVGERMTEFNLAQAKPARMEVLYVRDMALAAAPVAAPPAPMAPAVQSAPPAPVATPARAASAPELAASRPRPQPDRARVRPRPQPETVAQMQAPATDSAPPEVAPEPTPGAAAASEAVSAPAQALGASLAAAPAITPEPTPEPTPETAPAPTPAAAAIASVPAASASATAARFDWPVSTRVSYTLTGNVRGEVNGDAQVEWIRVGNRYQVHLDLTVGLSFAPLMTRRMSSDGDVTPQGLSPRRYDQQTKIGFGPRQQVSVLFEPYAVVLAGGQRHERWPGVQDTASQFIQLTYLFTTRPELLRPGAALEVPLALPRNLSRWIYDVLGEEVVYTPIGPITAFHLKPRRAVLKGADLSAEIWFAPQLRYLPVRIRIQQDADTFIDLVMSRKPELGAP